MLATSGQDHIMFTNAIVLSPRNDTAVKTHTLLHTNMQVTIIKNYT